MGASTSELRSATRQFESSEFKYDELRKTILLMSRESDDLENHNRWNNIDVYGITEAGEATAEALKS